MKRAALVMAGGSSERMRGGSRKTHKALREIRGQPLIEHYLRKLFFFGITDVTVAVNTAETELRCWLAGPGTTLAVEHGAEVGILVEEQPLGTIGAAGSLAQSNENLLVVNVDNLTDLDLRAFFNFHLESGAALTVASHQEPFRIPFGQLETSGSRVTAYKEKPVFLIAISSGTYMLHRRAMSAIQPGEKMHAPDLVNLLMQSGELVACFGHDAWWIDVNDESALAVAEAALARKPLALAVAGGHS